MKFETKEIQATVTAIQKVTHEARETTGVREALLFCDILDRKKGEIYQEVFDGLGTLYNRAIIREGNNFKIEYYQRDEKGGVFIGADKKPVKIAVLDMIIPEFPEYPSKEVMKDGAKETERWAFTAAMKQVSLDKERISKGESPVFNEDQTKALNAINRFSTWASGANMALTNDAVTVAVMKEAEKQIDEHIERASKEGLEILPAKLEQDKRDIISSVRSQFKGARAPRLLDTKGNVKADDVKTMPDKAREDLIKILAENNPAETEKILSAVTGKAVSHAPKIEEMRASALIDELTKHTSDFKEPGKALKLMVALRAMLLENVEPVSTGETKVKKAVNG